jgi:hypothetical protein
MAEIFFKTNSHSVLGITFLESGFLVACNLHLPNCLLSSVATRVGILSSTTSSGCFSHFRLHQSEDRPSTQGVSRFTMKRHLNARAMRFYPISCHSPSQAAPDSDGSMATAPATAPITTAPIATVVVATVVVATVVVATV